MIYFDILSWESSTEFIIYTILASIELCWLVFSLIKIYHRDHKGWYFFTTYICYRLVYAGYAWWIFANDDIVDYIPYLMEASFFYSISAYFYFALTLLSIWTLHVMYQVKVRDLFKIDQQNSYLPVVLILGLPLLLYLLMLFDEFY